MFYARRFGAFLPLVSVVTSTVIAYLIKDYLAPRYPDYWRMILLSVALVLFVVVYTIFYLCNAILIRLLGTEELADRLERRWKDVFEATDSSAKEDYVDRVAGWQLRLSMPAVVNGVVVRLLSEQKSHVASLRQALDHYSTDDQFRAFLNILGGRWKAQPPMAAAQSFLVDDPIHGCITLDSALAMVVAQPIVQRLGHIRQLSFSYPHFPSVNHSRLSHVLGVAHNLEKALAGVFSRGLYYQAGTGEEFEIPRDILEQRDRIAQKAKLLAILHDLGHGPFGHALDNHVGYINGHQITPNPDKAYSRSICLPREVAA